MSGHYHSGKWFAVEGTQGKHERPCHVYYRKIKYLRKKYWDFIEWLAIELDHYARKAPVIADDDQTEYFYSSKRLPELEKSGIPK